MKLSPRLQAIADMVDYNSKVGDVGTDHGYVPIFLVDNKIVEKAIASDINKGPTENAKKTVVQNELEDLIDVRLGGGLLPYEVGEIDTVIIAGMGGLLIAEILEERPEMTASIEEFILQPMLAQSDLRKWLEENGFEIVEEQLAEEGEKIYEIIKARKGTMVIDDEIFYEIGVKLLKKDDDLSKRFIEKKIGKYGKILENIRQHGSEDAKKQVDQLIEKIQKLEGVLKCL